ncbi:MAG: hypothetical protein GEU74_13840 [Nitriliruptorales bacterium]|nr:hypothetical protein [Nitriliruptorales bacterium]
MRKPVQTLRDTSAGQDAQFATAQARALGVTRNEIAALRARGEIRNLRQGIWRFTSAPGAPDPAVTAVLLCWPDGVISHRSAAVYHCLTRVIAPEEPDVTVTHGQVRRLPGIAVHWSRNLPPSDVVRVAGIGYTTQARTVCDLADPADPWETLAMVDDMIAAGARRRWIHQRATALANGRGGVRLIRDATAPDAAGEFRSWLERAAAHAYRAGGLPDPEWNVRIRDHRGLIGIVDAVWPQWRVISEKEGLRFHTTPRQRRADAERFNRLQDAGYRPRRFTWEDVVHRPREMLETLYRALNAAGADLDPARIPRKIVLPTRPFVPSPNRLVDNPRP